jgi:lysozyme
VKLSKAGVALIAEFEGFVGHGYDDAAGHCTIGYGHLLHLGRCSSSELRRTVTNAAGLELLAHDAGIAEAAVNRLVRVSLAQGEFDALVSFTFNVGTGALEGSTLLRKLNAGDRDAAANEFLKWTRAGGVVLSGLVRRRTAERALFVRGAVHAPEGRLASYTKNELAWIREYDALRRSKSNTKRQAELRALMAAQRKRIWRLAQSEAHGGDGFGWDHANRLARYRSLLARSR